MSFHILEAVGVTIQLGQYKVQRAKLAVDDVFGDEISPQSTATTAAHPLIHHKPVRNAQSHYQPPDPQAHVSLAATQLASLNLSR
jgi:hypothetical protein